MNDALTALTNKLDERDQKCNAKEQAIDALVKQIAEQERSNVEPVRRLPEQDKKLAGYDEILDGLKRKNDDLGSGLDALEAQAAKCGDGEKLAATHPGDLKKSFRVVERASRQPIRRRGPSKRNSSSKARWTS